MRVAKFTVTAKERTTSPSFTSLSLFFQTCDSIRVYTRKGIVIIFRPVDGFVLAEFEIKRKSNKSSSEKTKKIFPQLPGGATQKKKDHDHKLLRKNQLLQL